MILYARVAATSITCSTVIQAANDTRTVANQLHTKLLKAFFYVHEVSFDPRRPTLIESLGGLQFRTPGISVEYRSVRTTDMRRQIFVVIVSRLGRRPGMDTATHGNAFIGLLDSLLSQGT